MSKQAASAPPAAARSPEVGFDELLDHALLKKIWQKSLRKRLRSIRFQEFELGHDAMEHLAFDWELDDAIDALRRDVRSGTYRAASPEVIRAAKTLGLTRPLAFLKPRDLLLYKTIVALAENALLSSSKPWARFGRADTTDNGGDTLAESGWFRSWLKRQGQVWTITENHKWLIETDVANFFPYIQVPSVLRHVLANSTLSEDIVRLLEHMLHQFAPLNEYRISPVLGLPQENFDSSRILAHTYLKPIDSEFETEGSSNRYSRWVDDIVIGTDTKEEAVRAVRRVQIALEKLGLYPNSAKTRIVRSQAFEHDYMKSENDYLGEIEERRKQQAPEDIALFHSHIRRHLALRTRPKAWARVLRRYYTASRQLRDNYLVRYSLQHIEDSPESARTIFEYLAAFPLTPRLHSKLVCLLSRLGGTYEDIDLLAHEFVCTAPNRDTVRLRTVVGDWATELVRSKIQQNPRLAAAACLSVGKFGLKRHLDELEKVFRTPLRVDSVARQQAVVVLAGHQQLSLDDTLELAPQTDLESARQLRFLRALMRGERKACRMALSLAEPAKRRRPERYVMRPRALFLVCIAARVRPDDWQNVATKWMRRLQVNDANLIDSAVNRLLPRSTPSPRGSDGSRSRA
ncbi:MAG: RNA-directed DNA polymerase [Dehalococcoidia bacterium]